MKKEMLINCLQPEEIRIAIIENGVLDELYVERASPESYVGNIYKGRIVNIEPSIQAAFVDFGVGRNGFLHVSDVEPAYYRRDRGSASRPAWRASGTAATAGTAASGVAVVGRPRNYDEHDSRPRREERQAPRDEGDVHDPAVPPPSSAIFSEARRRCAAARRTRPGHHHRGNLRG